MWCDLTSIFWTRTLTRTRYRLAVSMTMACAIPAAARFGPRFVQDDVMRVIFSMCTTACLAPPTLLGCARERARGLRPRPLHGARVGRTRAQLRGMRPRSPRRVRAGCDHGQLKGTLRSHHHNVLVQLA